MPLTKQLVDIGISVGLDQKTDNRYLEPEGAATMQNCVRLKRNATRKRFGHTALSSGIIGGFAVDSAIRGQSLRGAPVLMWPTESPEGNVATVYSDYSKGWTLADKVPEAVALDRIPISTLGVSITNYDVAAGNGFIVTVMTQVDPDYAPMGVNQQIVFFNVADANGTIVVPTTIVTGVLLQQMYSPRVVICGDYFIITYINGVTAGGATAGDIVALKYQLFAPFGQVGSNTKVDTAVFGGTVGVYDAVPIGGDISRFALAYEKAGPGEDHPTSGVVITEVNVSNLTILRGPTVLDNTVAEVDCIALRYQSAEAAYCTYSDGSDTRLSGYSDFFAIVLFTPLVIYPNTLDVTQVAIERVGFDAVSNTGTVTVFWGTWDGDVTYQLNAQMVFAIADVLTIAGAGPTRLMPSPSATGFQLISRPQVIGEQCFAVMLSDSFLGQPEEQFELPLQPTAYLVTFDWWGQSTTPFENAITQAWGARIVCTFQPRLSIQQAILTSMYYNYPNQSNAPAGAQVLSQITLLGGPSGNVWVMGVLTNTNNVLLQATLFAQPVDFSSQQLYFGGELGGNLGLSGGLNTSFDGAIVVEDGFPCYPEFSNTALPSYVVAALGGLMSLGGVQDVYSYVQTYEWTDSAGNRHRSSPSVPFVVTMDNTWLFGNGASITLTGGQVVVTGLSEMLAGYAGASPPITLTISGAATPGNNGTFPIATYTSGSEVTITNAAGATDANNGSISWFLSSTTASVTVNMPQQTFSWRDRGFGAPVDGHIECILWRSTAGGQPGLYYRVSNLFTSGGASTPAVMNNPMLSFQPFVDTLGDQQMTTAEGVQLCYVAGGVLPNYNPPSGRIKIIHRNRFWIAGCDDPTQVWPSKQLTNGEAPGHNESMQFIMAGAVRALASMDDKIVAFEYKGTQPWLEYITGDGPDDEGGQSNWSTPEYIPCDATAVDQRCVQPGPFGVVFRSEVGGPTGSGGIFLLTRDLQVQYLSAKIEDTIAAYPICTSMLLHPNAGRVYITMVDNDYAPTTGVRLVWDYLQGGIWSIDNLTDVPTTNVQAPVRDAWLAYGLDSTSGQSQILPHWASVGGSVYRETIGIGPLSYTDAGAWIYQIYDTTDLRTSFSGSTRFWRIQIQGDALDPSNLTVTLVYDGVPIATAPYKEVVMWTAAQIAAFDRYPQTDYEVVPANQRAKSMKIRLADGPPTGVSMVTGQGPSWAGFTVELGVDGRRYEGIGQGQRQ